MSIATQITALTADNNAIRNAIIAKGGTVSQNSGFDTFANDLATIQDALIEKRISGDFESNALSIGEGVFWSCYYLSSISFPNATTAGQYAFYACGGTSINIPNLQTAGDYCFTYAHLKNAVFPKLTAISYRMFQMTAFLEKGDFASVTSIGGQAFWGSAINVLILRHSAVVTLSDLLAFNNTSFRNGAGGTVYVPQSLIEDYQNATNWSALESVTFAAIEGSEYDDSN